MGTKDKKILITDDDKFFQAIYADAFEAQGYTVIVADNGKEGLVKMRAELPDAVILDLVMPEMDGYEVLEEVKKDTALAKIPLLVLTGVASEEECRQAEAQGALKCLSKLTILPDAVVQVVSNFLSYGEKGAIEKLRLAEIGEGQRLNKIFLKAGSQVAKILEKILGTEIALGKLKATATGASDFKKYLEKAEEEEEEVMFYSVMRPPIATIILNIRSGFLSMLSDAVQEVAGQNKGGEIDKSALDEIFNIFANTFLSVITHELKSEKAFVMNIPRMASPDLILAFLEKDGFVFSGSAVQFIFRQEFEIIKQKENFEIELIFILSREGLDALGGSKA